MAPDEYVRETVERAKTSFYWAMRLLPADRRRAMYAIYAFCREVDDIADGDLAPAVKRRNLAGWRDEIAALYGGAPRHPITLALQEPVARFALRREDFLAVIAGMEMDAAAAAGPPSAADLDLYCDRVASAVGRLSVRAFGDWNPRCDDVAFSLGRALQLTNILRDLAEDAGLGRIYLPRETLRDHGILADDPQAILGHPALPAVCREVAAQARSHFDAAEQAMADCSRRAMRPAALMRAVYRKILDRLERAGWADPTVRVELPKPVKLWYALRYGLL